jgi:hypothetical protein
MIGTSEEYLAMKPNGMTPLPKPQVEAGSV